MLTAASCWRECTRCFCFASPSTFAFTWATMITIRINSCPVKCSRNVAGSGHFVAGRLDGSNPDPDMRIGNEKSACVDRSTAPCCWVLLGDNSVGSGKYGYPGFRGLDSCGLRLNHDREAFADMSCSHKNVILIVTNGSKKSA